MPECGMGGTALSFGHLRGTVRLVVYGDPNSGKPTSWELYEWRGTGKKQPETNIERNSWQKIPTIEQAVGNDGFWETLRMFKGKKEVF